jgi:hypothetical protein
MIRRRTARGLKYGRNVSPRKCIPPLSGESLLGASMMMRMGRVLYKFLGSLGTHFRHQGFRRRHETLRRGSLEHGAGIVSDLFGIGG